MNFEALGLANGPGQDQPEAAIVGAAELELDGHALGRQLLGGSLVAPAAQRLHHRTERQAGRTEVVLPTPAAPGRAPLDQPGPLQGPQPLGEQGAGMPGSPRCSSLNRWLPASSSRRISGVQRSANTSAPSATGQNWP